MNKTATGADSGVRSAALLSHLETVFDIIDVPFEDNTGGYDPGFLLILPEDTDEDPITAHTSIDEAFTFFEHHPEARSFFTADWFEYVGIKEEEVVGHYEKQLTELLDKGRGYHTILDLRTAILDSIQRHKAVLVPKLRALIQLGKLYSNEDKIFVNDALIDGDDLVSSLAHFAVSWHGMTPNERKGLTYRTRKNHPRAPRLVEMWRDAAGRFGVYATLAARFSAIRYVINRFEHFGDDAPDTAHIPKKPPAQPSVEFATVIGKALRELRDGKDVTGTNQTIDFRGKKGNFLDWAGKVIKRSPSTARTAIEDAGCMFKGQRGSTGAGLVETIQALITFVDEVEE